jgi:predicted PurR-regulated permease PerM
MLSLVVVVLFAMIQPGGGLPLALKAAGVVVAVVCVEALVLGPRILGKMMEIHPVLITGLLPVAHYFFGIWGLILATPLAVYAIHVLVLRHGLPGAHATSVDPNGVGPDRPEAK